MFRMIQHIAHDGEHIALCGKPTSRDGTARWPRFSCVRCLDLHMSRSNEVGEAYNTLDSFSNDMAARMDAARMALHPRFDVTMFDADPEKPMFIIAPQEDDVDE